MKLKKSNTTLSAETVLQALADNREIHLTRCRIEGDLDLNHLFVESVEIGKNDTARIFVFSEAINFNSCTFEGDVVFSGPWESPDVLKVVFEKEALFNSSVFTGQSRFSHAEFRGLSGFDGCTFCRVSTFSSAVFYDRAMFRTAVFEGYGLFNEGRFAGETRFANTCFGKGVNFTNVRFENRCDFAGVYSRNKSVPIYTNAIFTRRRFGDDTSFWRFVKQVCQEAGHYQQAGECFYRERCADFWVRYRGPDYEKLTPMGKIWRSLLWIRLLPEFLLGRMLFGYGERPTRVLVAGAVIILACAFFYSYGPAVLTFQNGLKGDLSFIEGLYYSTVTFTTLGFGDFYPAADMLTRVVTMLEALSGACLMALFVVTLSKRFSRG